MFTDIDTTILGDIATWVSAIGTLGAFIVGFKQIHTERHARKKREAHEVTTAEREQAKDISAWVDGKNVIVSNSSSHPVHNITIELAHGETIERHTIAPGTTTLHPKKPVQEMQIADFTFTDTKNHIKWQKVPGKPLQKID